jgi:serine-type D-Ala-D-Ala carboxypeptidase/endopeptidase (penicillin-binding protein 4)
MSTGRKRHSLRGEAPVKRSARLATSGILAVALAALAVPVGINVAPAVVDVLQPPAPEATVSVPAAQQPPGGVPAFTAVEGLGPDAPVPDPAVLSGLLQPELAAAAPGNFTAVVLDALTGQVLFDQDGAAERIPASNLKLLTAAAALDVLDGDNRFRTSVMQGADPGSLVLRGGGDVLLGSGASQPDSIRGHAGLQTLAEETVAALVRAGVSGPVTVQVDDSLFEGPAVSSAWDPADVANGEMAPLHALAINSSWLDESRQSGPRSQDAALAAGEAFRAVLAQAGAAAGITVTGTGPEGAVVRGAVPAGAAEIAAVSSATVAEQVQLMLRDSDNYLAEALARMTALRSGKAGSFGGGTEAVKEAVIRLGVPAEGMILADASGLSARNRLSARQLVQTVRILAGGEAPGMAAALQGLPIAGLTGTLDERFAEGPAAAGAGLVRAKTGTLNEVTALSGYVVDADGRLLVFAFVANGLEGTTAEARAATDRAAAVLAGCGCR